MKTQLATRLWINYMPKAV